MKGKISKIKNTEDELVLPITTVEAVYMEDGTTKLSDEMKDVLKRAEMSSTIEEIEQIKGGLGEINSSLETVSESLDNIENEIEDLKQSGGSKADTSDLTSHIDNTTVHVTESEKSTWYAKSNLGLGTSSNTAFRGDYGNTAYQHSQTAHAPSNAQKNSDITKAEIESKLTGNITTHIHDQYVTESELNSKGYLTQHQDISGKANILDLTSHTGDTSIHVTSTEKTTWNNKSNFDGNYNSLTNRPTIPTKTSQLINDSEYLTQHQDISGKLDKTHNTSVTAHSDIRELIDGLSSRLNALADSDGDTLDQISEMVAYIENNKNLIDSITTNKINISDIVDNLTTSVADKPLSAKQGVQLKALIDTLTTELNTKANKSELHSHSNKSVLDGITSSKITEWNNKSTFSGNYNDLTNKPTIPTLNGYATEQYVNEEIKKIDVTEQLTDYAKKSELHSHSNKSVLDGITSSKITEWDNKSTFDGNYNSLTNKPTIPKASNYKTAYGTCSSTASTSAKVVVIDDPNWELEVGNIVAIYFPVSNTASNVTLNINNTGAYPIWFNTSEYTGSSTSPCGQKNAYNLYMFNGTHWVWLSKNNYPSYSQASLGQGYGVCTTAESTLTKTSTISSYSLAVGGVVSIKFTYGVPANSTLNITSKGAKPIFYRGVAITDGIIKAGDTATFIYDGTQYQLISLDSVIDGYVTPQMFGAKGDGATDDTDAINQAIEYAGNNGIVYIPEGKYIISSSMSSSLDEGHRYCAITVYQKENLKIIISPKAHIKHSVLPLDEIVTFKTARYYPLAIISSSNITIDGGVFEGEADEHIALYKDNPDAFWWQADGTYSRGHGYGICIRGSDHITIKNTEVFNVFGDAYHISLSTKGKCNFITLENCIGHSSTRQGLSVTGGDNTVIRNCEFYNIVGNSPESGIDFEPDSVAHMNINGLVENCYIHDCNQYTIIGALANRGIKIKGCRLDGIVTNDGTATEKVEFIDCDIFDYRSSNPERNTVSNCRIGCIGIYENGDDFNDCYISPDIFADNPKYNITATQSMVTIGNSNYPTLKFNNCKFDFSNSMGYASNFVPFRGTQAGKFMFTDCEFDMATHKYDALIFNARDLIKITDCEFRSNQSTYNKPFVTLNCTNDIILQNNILNLKGITTYSNNPIVDVTGKNIILEHNKILSNTAFGTVPFNIKFSSAGEIYCLRNMADKWGTIGTFPSNPTKMIVSNNIISTSTSLADFTEEYKNKIDNVNDLIQDAGFITEVEAKNYTDTAIANINANGIQQTPLFANDVNSCTDTSKVYVLPDGNIYAYLRIINPGGTPLFKNWIPYAIDSDNTIFNGIGYKDGYRLNSSGLVVQETSGAASVTGFIPCKKGDIVRIKGITKGVQNYISQYKSDFTKYGNQYYWTNLTGQSDGSYIFDTNTTENFQTTTAYVRFSFGSFANAIITVNEEIVYSESTTSYQWTNTGHAFIPANYESRILALEEKIKNLNL